MEKEILGGGVIVFCLGFVVLIWDNDLRGFLFEFSFFFL